MHGMPEENKPETCETQDAKSAWKRHGKALLQQAISFGKSTSIKGIARVINSELILVKLMWLVAVVCFLSLAVVQTVILYRQFAKAQDLIVTKELAWDDKEVEQSMQRPPAFTVCDSHRSFQPQRDTDVEFESTVDFTVRVGAMIANVSSSVWHNHLSRIYATGYLETLGFEKLNIFAKDFQNFVIHCSFQVLPLSDSQNDIECGDWISVWQLPTPVAPTCYVIFLEPDNNYRILYEWGMFVTGFKLILYTGTFNETLDVDWSDKNQILDDRHGVLFSVHNIQNILPIAATNFLAPGYVHSVTIESLLRERRETSEKDSCLSDEAITFYDLHHGYDLPYNEENCMAACVDDRVLEQCGCLNQDALFSTHHVPRDTPYCGYVGSDVLETFAKLQCAQRNNALTGGGCVERCRKPCKQVLHEYRHSFARWPTPAQKLHFYRKFIRNQTFASHFSVYEEIDTIAYNDSETALELLRRDRLVEENFLQIIITDSQTTILKLEDVPQMTIINFIGQLGGVLNLYAGITVVVLVEVLELIIRLLKPYCFKLICSCKQSKVKTTKHGVIVPKQAKW